MSVLPARIAWRYLKAPKSHSAVSAISIISVVGIAIATAAIICVLSVFNGFKGLMGNTLDRLAMDVVITPAKGKTFSDADSLAKIVMEVEGVESVMPAVTDNALALFNSREMPVTLRGVNPEAYAKLTSIDSLLTTDISLRDFTPSDAALSVGVAQQLGIGSTDTGLLLFAPRREGRVNLANPIASFITDSVSVATVFQSLQSEVDENTIICDISTARDLFQYTTEATSLEVQAKKGADITDLANRISDKLGRGAIVKDKYRQQETHFRMVSIEKWMTFLLLIFILVIASFNIITTMCMLIIEKESSIATLSALGMTRRRIGVTFRWESLFVTLSGGVAGIILGLALCLLQEHFGLIKLGGDPDVLIIHSYPVAVEWGDVAIAFLPILAIGVVTACISSAFAKSRIGLPQ